jgi:hypothetical protein
MALLGFHWIDPLQILPAGDETAGGDQEQRSGEEAGDRSDGVTASPEHGGAIQVMGEDAAHEIGDVKMVGAQPGMAHGCQVEDVAQVSHGQGDVLARENHGLECFGGRLFWRTIKGAATSGWSAGWVRSRVWA